MSATSEKHASIVVTRTVRPGFEQAYEALLKGLLADAGHSPGYLGSQVIRPSGGDPRYHITVHFADAGAERQWEQSPQRREWLEAMRALAEEPDIRVLSGLETWFAVPAARHPRPPPRHRMTLVTWLAVYPGVLLFSRLAAALPWTLHPALTVLLVSGLTVAAAAYVLLPLLTRLFEPWLFR